MNILSSYYINAAFRPGVDFLVGDTRAVFSYDLISFDIDLNTAAADQVEYLCNELSAESGLAVITVEENFEAFTPYAWEILAALDKYGFLTELSTPKPDSTISGEMFWNQVESFASRAKVHFKPVLYSELASGSIAKSAIIRYALEYYHLVRHGPSIIAGVLPHVGSDHTRIIVERFLSQEIGHDKLLLRSLSAAGISEQSAKDSIPLPETFSLIAALQTLADQDPLSFKAVAFLLEESSSDFHAALREACEQVGLVEDFWSPIILHAEINDDGDHGNISAELLAEISSIGAEERIVVLKHVATLIESLIALEHAVLDPNNGPLPEEVF